MTVFLVGGSKGGVGKTLLSFALSDFFEVNDHPFAVVESDSANSDFSSAFLSTKNPPKIAHISLDSEAGFRQLIAFATSQNSDVIVNSPAGFVSFIRTHGSAFEGALLANNLPMITYWPINRERDSMNALKQFIDHITLPCIPVRNLVFGEPDEFELFNHSRLKESLDEKQNLTINMPALASRCAVQLRNERWTISTGLNKSSFSNRIELFRWRTAMHDELARVLKP